jgi:mono/diheme cytochrome c family protein
MLRNTFGTMKTLLLTTGLALVLASPAVAENQSVGKDEFRLRCAACHGLTGLGDGPVGQLLKTPAPNLALLTERNGGGFPV